MAGGPYRPSHPLPHPLPPCIPLLGSLSLTRLLAWDWINAVECSLLGLLPCDRPAWGFRGRAYQFKPTELYFPSPGSAPGLCAAPTPPPLLTLPSCFVWQTQNARPSSGPFSSLAASTWKRWEAWVPGNTSRDRTEWAHSCLSPHRARLHPNQHQPMRWQGQNLWLPCRTTPNGPESKLLPGVGVPFEKLGHLGAPYPPFCVLNGPEVLRPRV